MTTRTAQLMVASALSVTGLTGCGGAAAGDAAGTPNWGAASGVSANCDAGFAADYYLLGRHDIDGDGPEEWFVRLGCHKDGWRIGDQVEVFDGRSELGHPQRLGAGPLLHQQRGVPFVGCVTFEGDTVYLADKPLKSGGWHVVRVATWRDGAMRFTSDSSVPVRCAHPAPSAPASAPAK